MEEFIKNFKNQIEDISLNLSPKTDYVNSDFWDSLTAVTIQLMIEEEYGLNINIEKLTEFKSIEDLYNYIQNNK